ncbi:MAG: hypothetical protein K0R36_3148 [Chryseobacterium sp.]|jgi:hypothetical protein|nr:hypothetical protein [Chryseobacterium sp.]
MKNLKKLSRQYLKDVFGGKQMSNIDLFAEGSGNGTCAAKGAACSSSTTDGKGCCAGLTCIDCSVHKHYYCWN